MRAGRCVGIVAAMLPTRTAFDIRPATAHDVPAVQRIIAAAFRHYETVLTPDVFAAYLEDLLDVAGRIDTAEVLVARAGDDPIGTVTFSRDGGGLGMSRPAGWSVFRALAVTPARRARGRAGRS